MRVHHQVRGAVDVNIREHFVYPEGLNTKGELNYPTRYHGSRLPDYPVSSTASNHIGAAEARRHAGHQKALTERGWTPAPLTGLSGRLAFGNV